MNEPMKENIELTSLPVLAIKNTVLFPYLLMPLSVGRSTSRAAVEAALASPDKSIFIVAQRDAEVEEPTQEQLFSVGTRAIIKKMARSDDVIELIVQGMERVVVVRLDQTKPYLKATVRPLPMPEDHGTEVEALERSLLELAAKATALAQPQTPVDLTQLFAQSQDPIQVVYLLGSMINLDLDKEQQLLEAPTRVEALRLMYAHLAHEIQVLELRQKIAKEAKTEIDKQQRDYMLRQQMKAIQQELGEQDPEQAEAAQLRQRLEEAKLPEEVKKEAQRELGRLEKLPPAAPDYQVIRTYLDLVLELPWNRTTEDVFDLKSARQVLDEDHYDLELVKERILEQLAVLKLNPQAKAPILCFVGPPGVGKTSLGQSIARALGRKFERMSLGGMHDEAELRGHRRTYIGAMPGRIIQAIRRSGVRNPVLMLDEIDKLGRDFRGDPAAALMEILDPAQNTAFRDNYLDLPFDLSKVLFVTTANSLDTIPQALLDRMEVLRLSGYSEEEKVQIAQKYLVPRQLKEAGLKSEQIAIPDESVRMIIRRYTREAGLRELERTLGRLARKVARRVAEGEIQTATIAPDDLTEMLGPARFFFEQIRQSLPPGVATGLAWTEAGGDVLYVEAILLPGGRGFTLTGQLGQVMQESATAAQSYIWSHAEELGIDRGLFRRAGVHIHVPAGAVPKDGPSAGTALAAALASVYTQCPVRKDVAMTGEITLTGLVLPVGGIKEKVLAAHRAGIREVVLPRENEKDLRDIPPSVRRDLKFTFAERIEDVLTTVIPQLHERLGGLVTV
jgi:ATP-dependent Lon protease